MKISRKYPLFLLLTTVATGAGVFFALVGVLRTSIEREITKRGEATAQSFALANAPRILASEAEKLQYDIGALANDPDVVNARVADHTGRIIAALDPKKIGTQLPRRFLDPNGPATFADPAAHAYHFRAEILYGDVDLGTFVLSLSSTPLEAAVQRATHRALLIAVGIAALIAFFALLLVQREVRPLQEMGVILGAIAKGDFSQRVPVRRKDEIGQLAIAFNHMLRRAEIFFHYVDKMIIERLVADESLTRPGGRERNLAVVFGDMRGYTEMSNRRTADNVVNIVNTYFHLFVECIAYFQGVVDKTMGDAIMAVFEERNGEPAQAHRRRGALATAYMKAASRILNRFLTEKPRLARPLSLEPKEFGFAMASGRAIVGNIGSRRRMDYTVCGRVVNLASRLEGLTKHGEVIIDNFTHFGTIELLVVDSLPPVQPKGFSEKEKVVPHRLKTLRPDEERRMRKFLHFLFSFSFVQDVLMPKGIPQPEQHSWCRNVYDTLGALVDSTPGIAFFAPAEIRPGAAPLIAALASAQGKSVRTPATETPDGIVLITADDVMPVGEE